MLRIQFLEALIFYRLNYKFIFLEQPIYGEYRASLVKFQIKYEIKGCNGICVRGCMWVDSCKQIWLSLAGAVEDLKEAR